LTEVERAAFELLYKGHVDAVFTYALSRASREQAAEAVEETFLVAWRRFDSVPANPLPWLIGVARRVLSHQRRADSRRIALGLRIAASRAVEQVHADPAHEVIDRDAALVAFECLSEGDRELLCLIAWVDLTLEEVAKILSCSTAALRVRLHRARRRLESAFANKNELTASERLEVFRPGSPTSILESQPEACQ
jgi:RNA polymerase sigma-70 factor (ECF subfamily)